MSELENGVQKAAGVVENVVSEGAGLVSRVLRGATGEAVSCVKNWRVFGYGVTVAALTSVGVWWHDGVVALLPFLG